MTVKAVKLVSGEELIGEVVSDNNGMSVTLKNILIIMIQRIQTGELRVGFVPFAPYLGEGSEVEFELRNILFVKEVDDQMRNQYNSVFGGIVTPPKQILLS